MLLLLLLLLLLTAMEQSWFQNLHVVDWNGDVGQGRCGQLKVGGVRELGSIVGTELHIMLARIRPLGRGGARGCRGDVIGCRGNIFIFC